MGYKNSKLIIVEMLESYAEKTGMADMDIFTAAHISNKLGLSRNVVSQYLNMLFTSGELVKINTRPVYFFPRRILEESGGIFKGEYKSIDELKADMIISADNTTAFSELIGEGGSLIEAVEQVKAAISYPQNGLPVLLYGKTGTGKSLFAECMYKYAIQSGCIESNAPFVTINCSEYANNPELFLTNLFGNVKGAYTGAEKNSDGLAAIANNGVLFLDEVHSLSPSCQEKLFLLMDKGIYHKVGDNEKQFHSEMRFIFATTSKPQEALLQTFLRRIPVIVRIPSLAERPITEKRKLIYKIAADEEKKISKKIYFSDGAFNAMLEYQYEENVGQLKNTLKTAVANGLLKSQKDDNVQIHLFDLPAYILKERQNESVLDDITLLSVNDLGRIIPENNELYILTDEILDVISQSNEYDRIKTIKTCMSQYIDKLVFANADISFTVEYIERIVKSMCDILSSKHNIDCGAEDIERISAFLYNIKNSLSEIKYLEGKKEKEISSVLDWCSRKFRYQSEFSNELAELIKDSLGLNLGLIGRLLLSFMTISLDYKEKLHKTNCIIISEVRKLALIISDMLAESFSQKLVIPIETTRNVADEEYAETIASAIEKNGKKETVVITDRKITKRVVGIFKKEIKSELLLICDTTPFICREAAKLIKEDNSAFEIKQMIEKELPPERICYLKPQKKKKAILSICATGIGTAVKISELLKKSLPKKLDVEFLQYDYSGISTMKNECPLFSEYDVILIIGTENPHIEKYVFVSIEELVQTSGAAKVNEQLSPIMSAEELYLFNKNLLKNFSFQNLLNYLTILNPEKLIDYVEGILKSVQSKLEISLESNVTVGLYLHISCLIERLVTNRYIASFDNIEDFELKHLDFIAIIKDAFKEVEKAYTVTLPISEIGYLYNYIYNN